MAEEDVSIDAVAAAIRGEARAVAVATPAAAPDTVPDDDAAPDDDGVGDDGREVEERRTPAPVAEGNDEPGDIDVDEIPIQVTVDGQLVDVPLRDLKATYSGEAAIARRLQEATEYRSAVIERGNHLEGLLQAHQQRVDALDAVLSQTGTGGRSQVEWDRMKIDAPGKYLLERENERQVQQAREALRQEHQQVAQRRQEAEEQRMQEISRVEAQRLAQTVPELASAETAPAFMQSMIAVGHNYGISQQELARVIDHRQLRVLADLTRIKMGRKKAENAPPPKASPLMKASSTAAAARPMSDAKRLQMAALKRARASGRPEDVAATMLMRK